MPPRKRQAEPPSTAPVAKRRSARQAAAQQQQPSEPVPKESGAAKVASARKGKKQQKEGKVDDSDAEVEREEPQARRVKEKRKMGKVNASAVKQAGKAKDAGEEDSKKTKPAKAKGAKPSGESGAGRGEASGRAVSEDPDPDSLPTRNPEVERHEGEWYWLMKAEPESRFENGIDVRFSIDDLRAREKPEPWDGGFLRLYLASVLIVPDLLMLENRNSQLRWYDVVPLITAYPYLWEIDALTDILPSLQLGITCEP